jgi:nudix-type nucleoside diphosphatase (YffH/AdpP family)
MNHLKLLQTTTLSKGWSSLKKITYELLNDDGTKEVHTREVYDRGNGATILLYNRQKNTVILTKQFRLPTYLNGNATGMMIEACAGMLDEDNPENTIRREVEEETGYRIFKIEKVMEAYMSPGSVTEILYFFMAEYTDEMKINSGGGLKIEGEHIEVLELDFRKALEKIHVGEIKDGKTIMLLQYAMIKKLLP